MTARSPAMRRYVRRFAAFMVAYGVLLVGTNWWFRAAAPEGLLAFVAATLPALPVLGVFWAIFRLLAEESDEFIRMMHVRQLLFATAFCLCVMTVWEFLQGYGLADHDTQGFGTAFVWFVGLGLGALRNAFALRQLAGES